MSVEQIRIVTVTEILKIRQQVLWPHKSIDFVRVPEDEKAIHFGLYLDNHLVSIISLFPEADGIRFRKFATIPAFQGKGFGSKLLEFVFDYSMNHHYKRIWCDARANAMGFYRKFGFQKFSGPFFKEQMEYYKIEKRLQGIQ